MDGTDTPNPLVQLAADLKSLTERVETLAGQPAPTEQTPEKSDAQKLWEDLEPGLKWGIENGQINPDNLSADVQALIAELGKGPVPSPDEAQTLRQVPGGTAPPVQ